MKTIFFDKIGNFSKNISIFWITNNFNKNKVGIHFLGWWTVLLKYLRDALKSTFHEAKIAMLCIQMSKTLSSKH